MIKAYMEDIFDFGFIGAAFLFTLFTDNFNNLLKITISPTLLSDVITLITQITIFIIVLYKLKIVREKNKKDGDS